MFVIVIVIAISAVIIVVIVLCMFMVLAVICILHHPSCYGSSSSCKLWCKPSLLAQDSSSPVAAIVAVFLAQALVLITAVILHSFWLNVPDGPSGPMALVPLRLYAFDQGRRELALDLDGRRHRARYSNELLYPAAVRAMLVAAGVLQEPRLEGTGLVEDSRVDAQAASALANINGKIIGLLWVRLHREWWSNILRICSPAERVVMRFWQAVVPPGVAPAFAYFHIESAVALEEPRPVLLRHPGKVFCRISEAMANGLMERGPWCFHPPPD